MLAAKAHTTIGVWLGWIAAALKVYQGFSEAMQCAQRRPCTSPSTITELGVPGFSGWFETRSSDVLGVPGFALVRRLPREREREAGKVFEDGGACNRSFLFVSGKRE